MAVHPTTLFVVVFGVRIAIRLEDPSIVERVTARLPLPWCRCSPARIDRVYRFGRTENGLSWTLFGDDIVLDHGANAGSLCDRFKDDLERFVALHARTHAIVQAVVVGWEGRAIVIPGGSTSARRFLVGGLIGLGAEYYSDKYAVIDVRGRVWPFPRALNVPKFHEQPERRHVEDCAGVAARGPLPLGWVVIGDPLSEEPAYVHDAARNHAVIALLSNAPAAETEPVFLLQMLRTAVRDAIVLPAPRVDFTAYELLAECVTRASRADLRRLTN